jgi:hypothetical protein
MTDTNDTAAETAPVTLTTEEKAVIAAEIAAQGWTVCPCCGWFGITVTKAGKLRKHGRGQTGNAGYGCRGSGLSVR